MNNTARRAAGFWRGVMDEALLRWMAQAKDSRPAEGWWKEIDWLRKHGGGEYADLPASFTELDGLLVGLAIRGRVEQTQEGYRYLPPKAEAKPAERRLF